MNKRKLVTDREPADKDGLEQAYIDILKFADNQVLTTDPLVVASVFLALSLNMYRSMLDDNDFEEFMRSVYNTRHDIKKFPDKPMTMQ